MTDNQVEDIKSSYTEKIEKKSIKLPPIYSLNRWLIKEYKEFCMVSEINENYSILNGIEEKILWKKIINKDIFFKFARKVWTQEIPSRIPFDSIPEDYTQMSRKDLDLLIGRTQITPELLEYFKVELRSNNISFDDEAFNKDLDVIQNRILQQLYTKLFGDRESYRASLTIDLQVQRALELLPEAESLLGDGGPY